MINLRISKLLPFPLFLCVVPKCQRIQGQSNGIFFPRLCKPSFSIELVERMKDGWLDHGRVNPYNRKLFSKKMLLNVELKVYIFALNASEIDYSSEKYLKWKTLLYLKKIINKL